MTSENHFIRRYRGAFSPDDCKKLIEYIDTFEENKLLTYDREKLHEVDHKSINVTHSYDLLSYSLKLKKIPAGGGFHAWHFENGGISYCNRAFVIQLYLNSDFEGGETEFLYQNRREEAKQGDVLIFPADFTHSHRGNPPINGVKYLITSWGLFQDEE